MGGGCTLRGGVSPERWIGWVAGDIPCSTPRDAVAVDGGNHKKKKFVGKSQKH